MDVANFLLARCDAQHGLRFGKQNHFGNRLAQKIITTGSNALGQRIFVSD